MEQKKKKTHIWKRCPSGLAGSIHVAVVGIPSFCSADGRLGVGDMQRTALSVISCWGHMCIRPSAREDWAGSSACLGLRSAYRGVTLPRAFGSHLQNGVDEATLCSSGDSQGQTLLCDLV